MRIIRCPLKKRVIAVYDVSPPKNIRNKYMIEFTVTMAGQDLVTRELCVVENSAIANKKAEKYFKRLRCNEIYLWEE